MWTDDQHWYPFMLSGRYFAGRVDCKEYVEDGVKKYSLQRWWFGARDA